MTNRTDTSPDRVRWPIVWAGGALAVVFATATLLFHGSTRSAPPPAPPDLADSLVTAWIGAAGGSDVLADLRLATFTVSPIAYDTLSGRGNP